MTRVLVFTVFTATLAVSGSKAQAQSMAPFRRTARFSGRSKRRCKPRRGIIKGLPGV